MKNWTMRVMVLVCVLSAMPPLFAEEAETARAFDEKLLRDMTREERDRRIQEIARSVSDLDRKVTRLSDRLDRIEYDLKEVKRKVKVF